MKEKHADFRAVRAAQDELVKKFGTPAWLAGIALMRDGKNNGFLVEVRILGKKTQVPKLPHLPDRLKGVKIRFRRIKEIPRALAV